MESDKKNLIIIAAVVIAIIIGFILYIQKGSLKPGIQGPEGINQPPSGGETADFMRKAIDAQDPSLCANAANDEDKAMCRVNVIIAEAGAKQDAGICDQINQSALRVSCKDSVLITKALNTRNPKLCDQMTDKTRTEQCKKDVGKLLE